MPTFSYKCQECHEHFDYSIYRSDDKPHCPYCSSERLEKKVSSFSIGKRTEKLRTQSEVDRVCSKMKPVEKTKMFSGCARGYANKILSNYK